MTVPYISYKDLEEEFYTLKTIIRMLETDKKTLQSKCEQYGVNPQRNELGDWGLSRYDFRKLHNLLYFEDKEQRGGRKGDDPWA